VSGNGVAASGEFIRSMALAAEAGARWSLAKFYLARMQTSSREGLLSQALSECGTAVQIVRPYDDRVRSVMAVLPWKMSFVVKSYQ
jgi:hypothetical protein